VTAAQRPERDGPGPAVVLVGPMGAGKSTVGGLLAARLGVGCRDTDCDVEARAGTTIADIFVNDGEPHFRKLEAAAVRDALAEHDGVLALGGGAVLDLDTRDLLRGQRVVFLDVGVADAAKRIGLNRDRPLLLGNVRSQWVKLMQARRPVYEEVAALVVDTSGRTPQDIADEILAWLGLA
jgi:shikimate kinase